MIVHYIHLLFLLTVGVQPTGLSFVEEYLDFEIKNHNFYVNGIYVVQNVSEQTITEKIIYPFPVELNLIDSIKIVDSKKGNLTYRELKRGIIFNVTILPNEVAFLNIGYQQKVLTDSVIYILTTTESWGAPLQKVMYSFTVDNTLTVNNFSYLPDTTIVKSQKVIYKWRKTNFLPKSDFVVYFK